MKLKAAILLAAALLVSSCGGDAGNGEGTVLPTIPVETEIAATGSIEVTRDFTGGLIGLEQADIHIRLAEAVVSVPVVEGNHVKKDQVIIELDKTGASSRYYQANAAYENARKNYEKMKHLFAEGAISESAHDQAEALFKVARADYLSARELVSITSPIAGKLVYLGVKEGDVPHVGQLAARVARTDSLCLTIGVPDALIDRFEIGMKGIAFPSGKGREYECVVTKVARAADPATRTFDVEVTVPNADGWLQAGTFARVRFVIDRCENVIRVPQSALISIEGIYTLYVIERDTAYTRNVTLGVSNGVTAEIVSGLAPDEEYVVLGQAFLDNAYPIVRSQDKADDSI